MSECTRVLTQSELVEAVRAGLIDAEKTGHNRTKDPDYTQVPFVVDADTTIELIVAVPDNAGPTYEIEREVPTCKLTSKAGESHTLHYWDLELMIDLGLRTTGFDMPMSDEWDYAGYAAVEYISEATGNNGERTLKVGVWETGTSRFD